MRECTAIWQLSGVMFLALSLFAVESHKTQERVLLLAEQSQSCSSMRQQVDSTILLQGSMSRGQVTLVEGFDVRRPHAEAHALALEHPPVPAVARPLQRPAGLDIDRNPKADATEMKAETLSVQPPPAQVHTPSAEHLPVLAAGKTSRQPARLDVQVDASVVKPGSPDEQRPHGQGHSPSVEHHSVLAGAELLQHPGGIGTQQISQVDAQVDDHGGTVADGFMTLAVWGRRHELSIGPGPFWAAVWVLLLVCFVLLPLAAPSRAEASAEAVSRPSRPSLKLSRSADGAAGGVAGEPGQARMLPLAPAASSPTHSSMAADADGLHLCPEPLVLERNGCTLLVPLTAPSGCGSAITIRDLHEVPVCKAAVSTAKSSGRRVVLSSATGDAVIAFCSEAGADSDAGLTLFDRSERALATLRADGPRHADGYSVVSAYGGWRMHFRGNPAGHDLNARDDQGSLLATIGAHGVAHRSVRIGPRVDAGLMVLALLGIDLLQLIGSEDEGRRGV